jgi:hypothetical protein
MVQHSTGILYQQAVKGGHATGCVGLGGLGGIGVWGEQCWWGSLANREPCYTCGSCVQLVPNT